MGLSMKCPLCAASSLSLSCTLVHVDEHSAGSLCIGLLSAPCFPPTAPLNFSGARLVPHGLLCRALYGIVMTLGSFPLPIKSVKND